MKTNKTKLPVSELFYSIQGEGITMGIPAVFLRLGGCNLLCKSDKWVCDTIEVWQKSKAIEFENILPEDYIEKLKQGAHLVITGGEPLLHQTTIYDYLMWFNSKYEFSPFVEIETNGTILPNDNLIANVDIFNVSPKLSSIGAHNKEVIRKNPYALKYLNTQTKRTIFKFVISGEEDVNELFTQYVDEGLVDVSKLVLMPAGSSQEELAITRPFVAQICIDKVAMYCDRLHIVIWNMKTGV
jgi:organic radical activating enzyme